MRIKAREWKAMDKGTRYRFLQAVSKAQNVNRKGASYK